MERLITATLANCHIRVLSIEAKWKFYIGRMRLGFDCKTMTFRFYTRVERFQSFLLLKNVPSFWNAAAVVSPHQVKKEAFTLVFIVR